MIRPSAWSSSIGDRALFTASRFVWPIHSLILLVAIGRFYGAPSVADYTYALVVCAPLYFLFNFSTSNFLLSDTKGGKFRRGVLFVRLATAAISVPIVSMAAVLVPSTQSNFVLALWVVKISEMLFDPVVASVAMTEELDRRGRKLFFLDCSRVILAQALVWVCLLVLHEGPVVLLLVTGLGSCCLSFVFLLRIPKWTVGRLRWCYVVLCGQRMLKTCIPMTCSGALLAFMIGLPRLLIERVLKEEEQAMFGIAQTVGSVIAMLFNSAWLYEVRGIKASVRDQNLFAAVKINVRLTATFAIVLIVICMLIYPAQSIVLSFFGIDVVQKTLFPLLILVLGTQHALSVHRDLLKLIGEAWTEVRILVLALAGGVVAHFLVAELSRGGWVVNVAVVCVVMVFVQTFLSFVTVLRRNQMQSNRT